jgi:hypothetical protein
MLSILNPTRGLEPGPGRSWCPVIAVHVHTAEKVTVIFLSSMKKLVVRSEEEQRMHREEEQVTRRDGRTPHREIDPPGADVATLQNSVHSL